MYPTAGHGPLLAKNVGEGRDLIHGALEFLYRYDEEPKKPLDYNRAFGATDTLLDIEEALVAFETHEWPRNIGVSYLLTFGVFQALVIQQDAVRVLCKVFGVPFRPHVDPDLAKIRDLRVRTSGHPSHHKAKSGSTFLVRRIFSKQSALAVTYFDDPSEIERNEIDLLALYTRQQKVLCRALYLVWATILLKYPEAAHFRWRPWLAADRYSSAIPFEIKISA